MRRHGKTGTRAWPWPWLGCAWLAGWLSLACSATFEVPSLPLSASVDAELVARGEYLVHGAAHCSACHSAASRANEIAPGARPALTGGRAWRMGPVGVLRAPNLTPDVDTGLGHTSDAALGHLLRSALREDGTVSPFMRVVAGTLAEDDVLAVVSYLRSLAPERHAVPPSSLSPLGAIAFGGARPRPAGPGRAPPLAPTVERGRYLAEGPAACVRCHSDSDEATGEITPGTAFAGASKAARSEVRGDPLRFRAPNLTPDPETGIAGRWSEAQFMARMKAGAAFPGSPMPWGNYANLHDDDLRALWMFLRSLPPQRHDTGPSAVTPP